MRFAACFPSSWPPPGCGGGASTSIMWHRCCETDLKNTPETCCLAINKPVWANILLFFLVLAWILVPSTGRLSFPPPYLFRFFPGFENTETSCSGLRSFRGATKWNLWPSRSFTNMFSLVWLHLVVLVHIQENRYQRARRQRMSVDQKGPHWCSSSCETVCLSFSHLSKNKTFWARLLTYSLIFFLQK